MADPVSPPVSVARLTDTTSTRRRRVVDLGWGFNVALGIVLLILVLGLLAPVIARSSPLEINAKARLQGPSWSHWLGTDHVGRDVLTRLIFGARTAFLGLVITIAVTMVIGVPWGFLAGYLGGVFDTVLMRAADAMLSFPGLVLAIAITGALGPSLVNAMVALGVVFSPSIARLLRSAILPLRGAPFVLVARSLGVSRARIAVRHVVPNAFAPAFVQLCAIASLAIVIEASLSFLGLGVQPPQPSWGRDLADAYKYFASAPFATIAPGGVVTASAFCMTRIGDGLRQLIGTE
ncbi:MAG: ABC transporter permease [Ilumatobacteraceae bacterium]